MRTCCWFAVRCRGQVERTFSFTRPRKRQRKRSSSRIFWKKDEREPIMPVVDVVNLDGKKVGQVELADTVFGAEVNKHLLHEASRWYLAGVRRGTHKTKEKSEVSGAGRKLWRQKGTGRARIGSIRSPLWRHGGTVHGPQPRSYDYRFPRKKLLGALRSALAAKFSDGKLIVVNAFKVNEPKTKVFREALDNLKVDKTALLVEVANHGNRNLDLSSRNIDGVELVTSNDVHPFHLLRYDRAIFSQPAIEKLQLSLKNSLSRREKQAGEGESKQAKKSARSPRTRSKKVAEVA